MQYVPNHGRKRKRFSKKKKKKKQKERKERNKVLNESLEKKAQKFVSNARKTHTHTHAHTHTLNKNSSTDAVLFLVKKKRERDLTPFYGKLYIPLLVRHFAHGKNLL